LPVLFQTARPPQHPAGDRWRSRPRALGVVRASAPVWGDRGPPSCPSGCSCVNSDPSVPFYRSWVLN